MEVSVQGTPFETEVIRELLSPWDVAFVEAEKSGVEIVCGRKPVDGKKSIVIPSESVDFVEWTKKESLRIVRRPGEQISVVASTEAVLEFTPQSLYADNSSVHSSHGSSVPLQIIIDANVLVLTIDIIREYSRILNQTLNAKSSKTYDLLTRMPLPYDVAPKRVKDLLMAKHGKQRSVAIFERLPLDALRFALARALEKICGLVLHRRNWGANKDYACVLTHDIDTRRGLQNARYVKKLEEKYDIPSTWYVPSKCYSLDLEILKDLENCGEIGSHDTVHDGRLVQLSGQALINRLCESRNDLEKTANLSVEGFRAPLLQHTSEMLRGIRNAGYKYDSSIPTWEPKHPRTMRAHGLGTVYPISIAGNVEIPITIVQDHQLLYVLGLRPKETVDQWLSMMDLISTLRGCCVFLSHPEYLLLQKQNIALYEEMLNMIASDKDAWRATAKLVAKEGR